MTVAGDVQGRGGRRPAARPMLLLVAMLAIAIMPVATTMAMRGGLAAAFPTMVVLQTEVPAAVGAIMLLFAAVRAIGMVWVYLSAWDTWANEVALMTLFLLSPLVGLIVWVAAREYLTRAPRGKEGARFEGGRAIVPVYEPIGMPTTPLVGEVDRPSAQFPPTPDPTPPIAPPPYPQGPPPSSAQPLRPSTPSTPPIPPIPPTPSTPATPWAPVPPPTPWTSPPPPTTPTPTTPTPPPAPAHWSQTAPHPMGYPDPYGHGAMTAQWYHPQGWPYPHPPPPVAYRIVGERVEQKRDILAWHNILLLLIDAFGLATCVMLLLLVPVMVAAGSVEDLLAEDGLLFSPGFVLFSLIIQDGILVLFVWHQVVRRRVLTLGDMGLSRALLLGEGRLAPLVAKGLLLGLVLVGVVIAVELAQAALGFEATDALGPKVGDWTGYLLWLVSGCVIAPLSEEFFFRGYAFHAFKARYGLAVGVFASAVFFSAIHLSAYGFLPIILAGVGLALIYHWTRSLVPCIVAHALNNLIALTAAFMGIG